MQMLGRYSFQPLNLHRIYLRVFSENRRAVHMYENLGFKHEGRRRQGEFRDGRYRDTLGMSVLRDESTG